MKLALVKGTTSYRAYVFIRDSSVTTGVGLTGLVFNSSGLSASYVRPGAARTAITLATQTVTGAYSSGGFVEVDATNMPGVYRFDVPDAALASGVNSVVVMLRGATNMEPVLMEIQLTDLNLNDAVRAGLTALPNATAGGAAGLPVVGTGTNNFKSDSSANVTFANTVIATATNLTNLPSIPANWLTAAGIAASALNGKGDWNIGKTGYSISGTKTTLDALNDLSAAAVNAEVDTALADINLDHLMATALPTGWTTDVAANSALDYMADDGTAVYDRTTDSLQAIADSGGGGPTAAQIADAVWDEAQADHVGVGSFGEVASEVADILVDTNALNDTKVPDTISLANINAQVDTALADYDGPTHAELIAEINDVQSDIAALNDPTSAAIADAVWDEARAGHVAAGSFGEPFANIGVGNRIGVDVQAISGDTDAADNLERSAEAIIPVTIGAGSDTDTVEASSLGGEGNDTYNGRNFYIVTGANAGEGGVITDYVDNTTSGTLEFATSTFTGTGPSSGDLAVIV